MEHVTHFFLHIIDTLGYGGLFFVMVLGNMGVPIGAEFVVAAAGALAATGHLSSVRLAKQWRPSSTEARPARTSTSHRVRGVSRPSKTMLPPVTRPRSAGSRLAIARRSVVLPAPLGPTIARISPRASCSETSCSPTMPPA